MRKVLYIIGVLVSVTALIVIFNASLEPANAAKPAATCTPTGFYRDGINLTAAMVVTTSNQRVSGPVNASGCNIGIYFGPGLIDIVNDAQVFGANYYGIVNNGSQVKVLYSQIHDIGENPFNGSLHGYGVYFTEDNSSKGEISFNSIWNYQQAGIVVRGATSTGDIFQNTVVGQGPVNYIVQEGVEASLGAKAQISNNTIIGNSYTGTVQATGDGILVYGGSCYNSPNTSTTTITFNILSGNDVGIKLSNLDGPAPCTPTKLPTKINISFNTVTNDGINNVSGFNGTAGYQAGILDQGDADKLKSNSICGTGYTPVSNPPPYLTLIDVSNTNRPTVSNNTSCLDGSPIPSSLHIRTSATCTATGFYRDGINLTAAMIVTQSQQTISGTINAAGCNIGVYYGPGLKGTISSAQIFGANYFGVVNNGSNVTVTKSQIHDIGDYPLSGAQHGIAIYFAYNHKSSGKISKNLLWNYQKSGIVADGPKTSATITLNTVIGQGPVNYIAQNGIQIGDGATATITNTIVTSNAYTGSNPTAASGILVVGGACYNTALTTSTNINNNIAIGNDVGIWLSNLDGSGTSCTPTKQITGIYAAQNISTNDGVNNTNGATAGGYQAAITDQGNFDQMTYNSICGTGYTPVTPPPYLYTLDTTATNNPRVANNISCLDGSPITPSGPTLQNHPLASFIQ